jgi:hypothetical protein
MNKITLLLIVFSLPLFAGGEQGTGNSPESTITNDTNYQLVCTPSTDSTQLDSNQYCVPVLITTEN